MFIDSAKFMIKSGNGGRGCVSFRREKFIQLGGPDGGDGGKGGDVYFKVDKNTHTLAFYKGKKEFRAKNGADGTSKKMAGKKGSDLILSVPPGTCVYDDDNKVLLFDLKDDGEKKLILSGGKGGLGNVHFKNSINQRPTYAQPGVSGKSLNLRLELKSIADVGLVGFPNVGKSTLISVVSNAKPEIANYEFTTLTPKLGVVKVDEFNDFIMADIPGIIENASEGRGLGLKFLKHIERTKISLFVLDMTRDLKYQYNTLKDEIKKFSTSLAENKFAIILTKCDICENCDEIYKSFLKEFDFLPKQNLLDFDPKRPYFISYISSATNYGLKELKSNLLELLRI